MKEQIELAYKWPLTGPIGFQTENFILENDNEVFILGYDLDSQQYTVLGVLEDKNEGFYFYHIKQKKQEFYKKVINLEMNSVVSLKSDISTGFWESENFIKKEFPPKFNYYLQDIIPELVQKGTFTYIKNNSYMVYSGNGLYNMKELKKAL